MYVWERREERGDRFSFWKSRTFFVALSFFQAKDRLFTNDSMLFILSL